MSTSDTWHLWFCSFADKGVGGSYRCGRFVQVWVVRTGVGGSYRCRWFIQVSVVRTGVGGSYRCVIPQQCCHHDKPDMQCYMPQRDDEFQQVSVVL